VLGGVGCEGEGPESVVVGAGWVVEGDAACLGECVALGVGFVEGVASVGVVLVFLFMGVVLVLGCVPCMASGVM